MKKERKRRHRWRNSPVSTRGRISKRVYYERQMGYTQSWLHREDTAGISFGAERDITHKVSLVSLATVRALLCSRRKKEKEEYRYSVGESPSFDIDSLRRLTENARKRDAKFNRAYMNYDSLYFPWISLYRITTYKGINMNKWMKLAKLYAHEFFMDSTRISNSKNLF